MVTKTEQMENKQANNPGDIKKLFPFVITDNYKEFSQWHCSEVTYTNYGFKKNGNKYFFARRTCNKSQSYDYDDIIIILNTLKNSSFKFSCTYCQSGMLGSPNKFLDPLSFINWVLKNNYNWEDSIKDFTGIYKVKKRHWIFHGNLRECSSAFHFDIFDLKLVKKISKKTGLKIRGS